MEKSGKFVSHSEYPTNMVQYFKYKKTLKNTGKVGEICKSEKVGTILKKKVIKLILLLCASP